MTKAKKEYFTSYNPQPRSSRFAFYSLYSESCYTEEELAQREWIIKTRANSGIHPDYLANPSSWFAEDSQALVNVYERSWFYSNAFKTRHVLTRDDFYVHPIDSQRLQWPALYELMQKTGDYLLLRNQELPKDHLNQPMNFFLLDLNRILKEISQNPNLKQTREQLEHVTRYVRTIEKDISPFVGSDKLFLANLRSTIDDTIQPQLTHRMESQLLRDRLSELSKTLEQLSSERNRVLHFALSTNQVNPHTATPAIGQTSLKAYPTLAAKGCGKSSTAVVKHSTPGLQLTGEQLKDCPDFQLITMQEEVLDHYAKAITDLNELERFQKVVTQTMGLLEQAGEVFTVAQFKEQLSLLLKQVEPFIDESAVHIEKIIQANTQEYHKVIQEEQNLSYISLSNIKKWLTSERQKLNTFIGNQDTLAHFPSTTSELTKTNQALKQQVNHVIGQLNGPKIAGSNFAMLAEQAQELNTLMISMHGWIKVQYELKGLEPPQKPDQLELLPPPKPQKSVHQSSSTFFELPKKTSLVDECRRPNWTYETSTCPRPAEQPPAITACADQDLPVCRDMSVCRVQEQETSAANLYIGLAILLPIGILAIYFLYQAMNKPEVKAKIPGDKNEYEKIKTELDDLIIEIQRDEIMNNTQIQYEFEVFVDTYDQLNKQAREGIYDIEELKELHGDIKYFYQENCSAPASKPFIS